VGSDCAAVDCEVYRCETLSEYSEVAVAAPSVTSAVAKRSETWVTLILTSWPSFVAGTKTTNPSTLAIPSPRLLVSEMVTKYSLPISTGFNEAKLLSKPARLPYPLSCCCPKLILFTCLPFFLGEIQGEILVVKPIEFGKSAGVVQSETWRWTHPVFLLASRQSLASSFVIRMVTWRQNI
jgi:hypothetical protein